MPTAHPLWLDPPERVALAALVRRPTAPAAHVDRARAVLWAAQGESYTAIAARLGYSAATIGQWIGRYRAGGRERLLVDRPRSGRPPSLPDAVVQCVVETTLHVAPPAGATHWTVRTLAEVAGCSKSTVHQIWRAFHLQPHRVESFKLSTDPDFAGKLRDVVGLYLDPPEQAVVFSADEKSQCQALERTQQRTLNFRHPARRSHDYRRHGTTTLFAALNVLTGELLHTTKPRHRHEEWLAFLQQIERAVPADLTIHVICDNYCTHKETSVRAWLADHPRMQMHFTPTSASWLNLVERFFAELTVRTLRRGSFTSLRALEHTIHAACEAHNARRRPYTWTASAEAIFAKLQPDPTSRTGH